MKDGDLKWDLKIPRNGCKSTPRIEACSLHVFGPGWAPGRRWSCPRNRGTCYLNQKTSGTSVRWSAQTLAPTNLSALVMRDILWHTRMSVSSNFVFSAVITCQSACEDPITLKIKRFTLEGHETSSSSWYLHFPCRHIIFSTMGTASLTLFGVLQDPRAC